MVTAIAGFKSANARRTIIAAKSAQGIKRENNLFFISPTSFFHLYHTTSRLVNYQT
jgi:hypothetical protein